jgi:hypothetical protein
MIRPQSKFTVAVLSRCVTDIDTDDSTVSSYTLKFAPDSVELVVNQIIGTRVIISSERVSDFSIQLAEQVIPHLDHRIRWRGDDKINTVGGDIV